ncbi:MAG: hypothetical protein CL834_00370 [Crocinitomicaceae bacterium]|nr:hypothetical protein [Crocinitomicaceae bacterium]
MRLNALLIILALASLFHSIGFNLPGSLSPIDFSAENNVVQHRTIDFLAADETSTLQMDLYSCAESTIDPSEKSLFIFAHGGGFFTGSRLHPQNVQFCEALASHGIDVASMDYRLTQRGRGFDCEIASLDKQLAIESAAADMEQALTRLRFDYSNRIVIGGSSSGGHAALCSVYHRHVKGVAGVISMCGGMEPITTISNVPLLAFHGTCDALVPYGEAIHHYCKRNAPGALLLQGGGALAECLPQVELHAYLNGGHDLANSCLSDSNAISTCVEFIQKAIQAEPIGGTFLYETALYCELPSPFLPCQQ